MIRNTQATTKPKFSACCSSVLSFNPWAIALSADSTIRITKETSDRLRQLGDEKAEFCMDGINKALDERDRQDK